MFLLPNLLASNSFQKLLERILDATEEKIIDGDYYGCAESFVKSALYWFNSGIPSSNQGYYIGENGVPVRDPNYKAPIFTPTNLGIDGVISLIIALYGVIQSPLF